MKELNKEQLQELNKYGEKIALRYKNNADEYKCLSGFEYTLFTDFLDKINNELKDKYKLEAVIDNNETDVFICFTNTNRSDLVHKYYITKNHLYCL